MPKHAMHRNAMAHFIGKTVRLMKRHATNEKFI